jgi:two-component system LytT family response regulator
MKKRINNQAVFHNFQSEYRFAIQTITGIIILKCKDVLLFEYIKLTRKWQLRLTNDRIHNLRSTVNSSDITSISPVFVQINQYCIINLVHLLEIENKTLRCIFDVSADMDIDKKVSPLYYKKIKEALDIL